MYRRHLSALPRDLVFPDTFEGLGYFVNAKSQIRQIKNPKEGYVFRICTDERTNELNREAFHICVRAEVNKRMKEAGLQELYLPQETTNKPHNEPHLPIMITPKDDLKSKKRVIIIINHSYQDLGITSHRYLQREGGLEGGTLVRFVKNVNSRLADQEGAPGLVILNPGMLVFSHKANTAMTHLSWHCKRVHSRYHPSHMQHDNFNNIPGHTSPAEHIRSVFQRVINNPDYVNKNAHLYVVGLNDGADNFLDVASKYYDEIGQRLTAVASTQPFTNIGDFDHPELVNFLGRRARAWVTSDFPANTVVNVVRGYRAEKENGSKDGEKPRFDLDDVDLDLADLDLTGRGVCPYFSGGESTYIENIFHTIQGDILDFFEQVAGGGDEWHNPQFAVAPEVTAEREKRYMEEKNRVDDHAPDIVPESRLEEATKLEERVPLEVIEPNGLAKSGDLHEVQGDGSKQKSNENATAVEDVSGWVSRFPETVSTEANMKEKIEIAGVMVDRNLAERAGLVKKN